MARPESFGPRESGTVTLGRIPEVGRAPTGVAREGPPRGRFLRWGVPALWVGLGLATVLSRLRFATAAGVVDSDEAVIFLMARRIAELRDLPVFHYGNAYLGSFDAVLAAVFVRLLGDSALVGRLTPIVLSLLCVWTTYRLGLAAAGHRVGYLAATYVALGPPLLVVWGARLHLGYLDMLILGNLLLVAALRLVDGARSTGRRRLGLVALIGLLSGLGCWCHVLFLPFIMAVGLFLLLVEARRRPLPPCSAWLRDAVAAMAGFGIGTAPLLGYNLTHQGATLAMFRRGLELDGTLLSRTGSAVYNLLTVGLPVVLGGELPWRPHRSEFELMLPPALSEAALWVVVLAMMGLAIGCALLARPLTRPRARRRVLLLGVAALVLLALGRLIALTDVVGREGFGDLPDRRSADGSLALVRAEVLDRRMLVLALWLPAVAAFVTCTRAGSCRDRDALRGRDPTHGGDGVEHGPPCPTRFLLASVAVACVLLYLSTSYGMLRSPRFLFPLYGVLPVMLAIGARDLDRWRGGVGSAVWLAVIALNLVQQGAADPALAMQPVHLADRVEVPASYDELVGCLDRLGIDRVYGGYWTAFPLVLASDERVLVSNASPGRLPEADDAVASSERVAFVMYRNKLDERFFRRLMLATATPAQVAECGPFRIYTGVDVRGLRTGPAWESVQTILAHP